ncbi:MAG TPA: PKD domain-containing protein, partial [Solirubrobacterales bacterium]|nr:PKD domain-containing protein [Solirubrobacterales bacterium]
MHTHQSSPTRGVAARPALLTSLILLVLTSLLVCVANAHAAAGSQYPQGQYGEVPSARFGGFDSTWYDGGAYDGGASETAPTPGKFLNPVGFAVDTDDPSVSDGTAIYVLDRVSAVSDASPAGGTRWRLQKLSDTGSVVALTEFFLPTAGPLTCSPFRSNTEPVGLTVSGGNVYTVIAGVVGEDCLATSYAEEVVGWSTTPSGGKLVGAPGTPDGLSSPVTAGGTTYSVPSVVSTASDLASTEIFAPRGLTADGADSLVLLGDATNRGVTGEPTNAPALAVKVSLANGAETASWSSSSLSSLPTELGDTITTDPAGNIDIWLTAAEETAEGGAMVQLSPSLTSPKLLESQAQQTGNVYQALDSQTAGLVPPAGPHAVWLSNGLVAANPAPAALSYWSSRQGIRLISPLQDGTLAGPTALDTVYDTLGKSASGACDVAAGGTTATGTLGDIVLAPGKDGSVWMLNVGTEPGATTSGRIVAELAPGAADPCLTPPSGTTFSLTDLSAASPTPHAASAGPLTVSVGSKVRFGTEQFEYPFTYRSVDPPAAVYAFEWDPVGGSAGDPGYTLVDQNAPGTSTVWPLGTGGTPPTTDEFLYTTPGTYTVEMKAFGDLGEYDATGTVIVEASSPPAAAFTLPGSAQANQTVSFDASGSVAHAGARITNYHWSFGDGQEDDNAAASETHAYAAAGTYTVTLTVADDNNQQSTAVTHQITVTAASSGGGGGTGTGGGGSTN